MVSRAFDDLLIAPPMDLFVREAISDNFTIRVCIAVRSPPASTPDLVRGLTSRGDAGTSWPVTPVRLAKALKAWRSATSAVQGAKWIVPAHDDRKRDNLASSPHDNDGSFLTSILDRQLSSHRLCDPPLLQGLNIIPGREAGDQSHELSMTVSEVGIAPLAFMLDCLQRFWPQCLQAAKSFTTLLCILTNLLTYTSTTEKHVVCYSASKEWLVPPVAALRSLASYLVW